MNKKKNGIYQQVNLDAIDKVLSEFFHHCSKGNTSKLKSLLGKKPLNDLIDQRDGNGRILLHYCAECTSSLCTCLLVSNNPHSIADQDNDGYTILHLAVINGNHKMVSWLCKQARSIISEDIFLNFINAGDSEGHTAFHWAVVCNELRCLDILYDAGTSIVLQDIHGAHPLHYAAQMSSPHNGINKDIKISPDILRKLIDYQKINVNCRDKYGRTPLLWAASSGSTDAIMLLVNAGADIRSKDKDGLSALHCASSRGHFDAVETLINLCGAEIDANDSIGCSPLFYAVTLGNADCTQLLLQNGAEPNRQDHKGRTAAHCGAAKGQLETIKILANYGANLWLRNVRGDMPLHEAVKSGRKELVRWLLEQVPSAVNTPNSRGRTPLHIAAVNNNLEMCKVLIDLGADVNPVMKVNNHWLTPLDAALQRGYRSCAKFLLLHQALPSSRLSLANRSFNQKAPLSGLDSPSPNELLPQIAVESDARGRVNSSHTDGETSTEHSLEKIHRAIDPKNSTMSMKRHVKHSLGPDLHVPSDYNSVDTNHSLRSQSIITNVYVNTSGKQGERTSGEMRFKNRGNCSPNSSTTGQEGISDGSGSNSVGSRGTAQKKKDPIENEKRSKSQPSDSKPKKGSLKRRDPKRSNIKNSKSEVDVAITSYVQEDGLTNGMNKTSLKSERRPPDIEASKKQTGIARTQESVYSSGSFPSLKDATSDENLDLTKIHNNSRRAQSRLNVLHLEPTGRLIDSRIRSDSRCSHRLHHMTLIPTGYLDLSHVKAKVDTRGLDLARRPCDLKRRQEQLRKQRDEMMAKIEKSIRTYQMEQKIFKELQDLKDCQIKSGRCNEAVFVKRLVEKFRKHVKRPGMKDFKDSFTFKAYEKFLYQQLAKLSKLKVGKVLPIVKASSDENLALRYMKSDDENTTMLESDKMRQTSFSVMSDYSNYQKGLTNRKEKDPKELGLATIQQEPKVLTKLTNFRQKDRPKDVSKAELQTSKAEGIMETEKLSNQNSFIKNLETKDKTWVSNLSVPQITQNIKSEKPETRDDPARWASESSEKNSLKMARQKGSSRTTAKYEQCRRLKESCRRNCLKRDVVVQPVEASLNRRKFKRNKSSIPGRVKMNIPKDVIEKRWRTIKEEEKQKISNRVGSGKQTEFIQILYEINVPQRELDMIYEEESEFFWPRLSPQFTRSLSDSALLYQKPSFDALKSTESYLQL